MLCLCPRQLGWEFLQSPAGVWLELQAMESAPCRTWLTPGDAQPPSVVSPVLPQRITCVVVVPPASLARSSSRAGTPSLHLSPLLVLIHGRGQRECRGVGSGIASCAAFSFKKVKPLHPRGVVQLWAGSQAQFQQSEPGSPDSAPVSQIPCQACLPQPQRRLAPNPEF